MSRHLIRKAISMTATSPPLALLTGSYSQSKNDFFFQRIGRPISSYQLVAALSAARSRQSSLVRTISRNQVKINLVSVPSNVCIHSARPARLASDFCGLRQFNFATWRLSPLRQSSNHSAHTTGVPVAVFNPSNPQEPNTAFSEIINSAGPLVRQPGVTETKFRKKQRGPESEDVVEATSLSNKPLLSEASPISERKRRSTSRKGSAADFLIAASKSSNPPDLTRGANTADSRTDLVSWLRDRRGTQPPVSAEVEVEIVKEESKEVGLESSTDRPTIIAASRVQPIAADVEREGNRDIWTPAMGKRRRDEDGRDTHPVKGGGRAGFQTRHVSSTANRGNVSYVQVMGTGMDTEDTAPSVLLFFDSKRYLFNAGEGLQRYCIEHGIRLSKMDHVFLTRVSSETAGGLPGLLLTLANLEGLGGPGRTVKMSGPSDLQVLLEAMRNFVPYASMVHANSFGDKAPGGGRLGEGKQGRDREVTAGSPEVEQGGPGGIIPVMEDEVVKISAVLLRPSPESAGVAPERDDVAVVYVCELPVVVGKFDPVKAQQLGLSKGSAYGKLTRGMEVKSDDGTKTIRPGDVMGPSSPGPIIFIVDCPTEGHIASLHDANCLDKFYAGITDGGSQAEKSVACVVHLAPQDIAHSAEYRAWMAKLGSKTQHLMAGHGRKRPSAPILAKSARISARLNLVCPQVFPALGLNLGPEGVLQDPFACPPSQNTGEEPISRATEFPTLGPITISQNLMKFHLRPVANLGVDPSAVPPPLSVKAVQHELQREQPDVIISARQLAARWADSAQQVATDADVAAEEDTRKQGGDCQVSAAEGRKWGRQQMEMVFLGTGSSQPSKYRNVSSIYVHLFDKGGVLLDCGEGTYAQLRRRYGIKGADDIIAGLGLVWISHIHADHHVGLVRILAARKAILEKGGRTCESLLVIGPRPLKRFLHAYERLEPLSLRFLDCTQTTSEADSWAREGEGDRDGEEGRVGGGRGKGKPGLLQPTRSAKAGMKPYWAQPGGWLVDGLDGDGRALLDKALQTLGLSRLSSVHVEHCAQAYGVVIEAGDQDGEPGWKMVYSGDTRPCQALVEASKGASVLIHEATFDDALPEEAIAKRHSITREAIETGVKAGVYRTILTHFSQRYPKIPVVDDSYTARTVIAFDMMSANLADLEMLPSLLPTLRLLFGDGGEEAEEEENGDKGGGLEEGEVHKNVVA